MTKKHFKDLAQLVRIARRQEMLGNTTSALQWQTDLIELCKRYNSRFNETTFVDACIPTQHLNRVEDHEEIPTRHSTS